MNDSTTNTNSLSPEEIAIVDAAFKLYEIVFVHRCYKRRRGRSQFTRGAFEQARKTLAGLLPPAPGAIPARIVALFAKDADVTEAAIKAAIERLSKSRQEAWDSIRALELTTDELKSLTYGSPIFKHYRNVTKLDRSIVELSHPGIYAKAADAVWWLVNRLTQENDTVEVAA